MEVQDGKDTKDAGVCQSAGASVMMDHLSVQERILLIMLQYQIFRQAIWNRASFLKIILDNLNKDSPKDRYKTPVINSGFSTSKFAY